MTFARKLVLAAALAAFLVPIGLTDAQVAQGANLCTSVKYVSRSISGGSSYRLPSFNLPAGGVANADYNHNFAVNASSPTRTIESMGWLAPNEYVRLRNMSSYTETYDGWVVVSYVC